MTKSDSTTGKLKKLIKEILLEEEAEKKVEEEEKLEIMYSSEDKTPQPVSKPPYMVLYIQKAPAPFRKETIGWMGAYSKLYQGNHITCIEQTGNLDMVREEPRFVVLLKNLSKPPKRETMTKFLEICNAKERDRDKILKKYVKKKPSKKKAKGKKK
jgi:hypothetical protein